MNVCEFCSQLSDDAERAAITSLEAFSQEAEDDDYGDIPFDAAETEQTEGDREAATGQPGLETEPGVEGQGAPVDEGAREDRGPPTGQEVSAEAAPPPTTSTTDQGEQTVRPGAERITVRDFRAQTAYHENDWSENPDGEDYRQRISEAGRSDLLEWIDDRREAFLEGAARAAAEARSIPLSRESADVSPGGADAAQGAREGGRRAREGPQEKLNVFGPVNPRFAKDIKRIGTNLQARLKQLGMADIETRQQEAAP